MTQSNKILLLLAVLGLSVMTISAQETGVVINGVTWATRNVDMPGTFADNPEDAGMFYQWNRNVGWSSTDPMVNSDGDATWDNSTPSGITWESENDPCPAGWRVPTHAELQVLFASDVTNTETTENGVNGRRFTDIANSTSIFLPAAGIRDYNHSGALDKNGINGYYWSSSVNGTGSAVFNLYFGGITVTPDNSQNRTNALCVRCVKESGVGIKEVSNDTETATPIGYYDISGNKLKEEPKQGFYIIRYDNGKTKKVMKSQE